MSRTATSVRLTGYIARQLDQLTGRLCELSTREAAQVPTRGLGGYDGVLGDAPARVVAGSHSACDHVERGTPPAQVWLALGRAARELHTTGLHIDGHVDSVKPFHTSPTARVSVLPGGVPLVLRRRR